MKRSLDQMSSDSVIDSNFDETGSDKTLTRNLVESQSLDHTMSGSSIFSSSLVAHIKSNLIESLMQLRAKHGILSEGDDLPAVLFQQLVNFTLTPTSNPHNSNARLSKSANSVFRSFVVLPKVLVERLLLRQDLSVEDLIAWYEEYEQRNKQVYENITSHHQSITSTDWREVVQDNGALDRYKDAAHTMGGKKWVQGGNDWMKGFMIKYFKHGGAAKYFLRSTKMPSCRDLEKDVLQGRKIKVLDVGSCYNPLASPIDGDKGEDGKDSADCALDVTAVDLCPAHPSVLKCDFLAVGVHDPVTGGSDVIVGEEGVISLPMHSYDAVTMSLVLSYLPNPEARSCMIQKARALLRPAAGLSDHPLHYSGLLLIIEKISILHHSNCQSTELPASSPPRVVVPNVSLWKEAIEDMGYSSVIYQLLSFEGCKKAHAFAFCNRGKGEKWANGGDVAEVRKDEAKDGKKMRIKQDGMVHMNESEEANGGVSLR
eukprot:gene25373-30639_t